MAVSPREESVSRAVRIGHRDPSDSVTKEVHDDNPLPVKVIGAGGGGGPANVGIKDALEVRINPATEDTLELIRLLLDLAIAGDGTVTVVLDAPTLAALETISVANMIPAVETGLTKEVTLEALRLIVDDRLPDEAGTPDYTAGTGGGTVNVPAGARLQGISAWAEGSTGSFTVAGGSAITVRNDAGKDWNPKGRWVAPQIVFSATLDYVVEWTVADA